MPQAFRLVLNCISIWLLGLQLGNRFRGFRFRVYLSHLLYYILCRLFSSLHHIVSVNIFVTMYDVSPACCFFCVNFVFFSGNKVKIQKSKFQNVHKNTIYVYICYCYVCWRYFCLNDDQRSYTKIHITNDPMKHVQMK